MTFLALGAMALPAPDARAEDAPKRAELPGVAPAPGAQAYFDALDKILGNIDADMPAITDAAEKAADQFIKEGALGVRGEPGFTSEFAGRAGGFVACAGGPGKPGQPVLYALGICHKGQRPHELLDKQLTDAGKAKEAGSIVIGIASLKQLKALDMLGRAANACTVLLDNHAPVNDGIVTESVPVASPPGSEANPASSLHYPRTLLPIYAIADDAVGWSFCCELFAACTRRDKTPVMYQSIMVDTKHERLKKYQGKPFHNDVKVGAVAVGKLGKAYIAGVRGVLRDVGTASWPAILNASEAAGEVLADGGKVYIFARAHAPQFHHGGQLATDPGLFEMLNGPNDKMLAAPGQADFTLAVGYAFPPEALENTHPFWLDPAVIRGAGRGVAWVMASYALVPGDIHRGEILVDQRWGLGDAVVPVPGYDVRIAPSSGIVSEAMMWMITAEARAMLLDHEKHKVPRAATRPATAPAR
ncbi:MAG: hypothetical protein NTW19_05315 [Planctomycetota bacterium]|nr:hypothetical protein [Planctomycetota bacterium]